MTTERYSQYNTQIIESSVDLHKSREFLPLHGIDVIAKIPVDGGVALFYKNSDNNIVYGKFTLQDDETYDGTAVAISEEVTFETDDIYIINGYYDQNESFYIFYNTDNNIYVRTFLVKQGFMGAEILVKENYKVKKFKKIKENFFMVVEDLTKNTIINQIEELSNGELKLLTVFENDIIKYEALIDSELRVQFISIPFNDIGEEKWTCDNMVNNEKGFLYLTGDVKVVENNSSIKGISFKGIEKAYVEMNSDKDEYTLFLRIKISSPSSWVTLLQTNNILVEVMKDSSYEYFRVTFPDGTQQVLNIYSDSDFKNITITTKKIANKLKVSFFVNLFENQGYDLTAVVDLQNITTYQNDSLLVIERVSEYDYLSLQNYSLSKKAVLDVHKAFNKELVKLVQRESLTITGNDFNNYINIRQQEKSTSSIIKLPSTTVLAENNYVCQFEDVEKHFWLCDMVSIDGGEAENLVLYLESGSSYINDKATKGVVYAKSNSFVDLNNANNFVVYHETGADVYNQGKSVLIEKIGIVFDYTVAPSGGCPVENDVVPDQISYFPFFPSDSPIEYLEVRCVNSLYYNQRFIDNQDGTITDLKKYLLWLKSPVRIPQTSTNKQNQAYNFAKSYWHGSDNPLNNNINYNISYIDPDYGDHIYRNWRLPTKDELDSLSEVIDVTSTCVSGAVSGISGITYDDCISGSPAVISEETIFDFQTYIDNYDTDLTSWSATSPEGYVGTGSGNFYAYDAYTKALTIEPINQDHPMGLLAKDLDYSLKVEYEDGVTFRLPAVAGNRIRITKTGSPQIKREGGAFTYGNYTLEFVYDKILQQKTNLPYTKHYKLNSAEEYKLGTYISLDRSSKNNDLLNTVIPIFLEETTNVPNAIFTDPEKNLRIGENLTQKYAPTPFKVDFDNNTSGITVWTGMGGFNKSIAIQYSLKEDLLLPPTYSDYETLSSQLYSQDGYFCAYHFDKLSNIRRKLVNDITIDITGEIVLGGKTQSNTYLREITSINFFDKPKKYKTSQIDVEIDVKETADRESYINNYENVREFVSTILKQWKPATVNIRSIVERNTLVMAELLKDEFTQVLVGITPRQNTNAYYIRSVDTGEISILASSAKFSDEIDWLGIGRINTPYIKAGVSKIKKSVKNIKIPFETRFSNTVYRVFVFNPNNSKYFVTQKDKDGFIVESSELVESEVAWIALSTNQIVNGTINWTKGVPQNESVVDHLDRVLEINENSSKYVLSITDLGYPQFYGTDYTVILSSDSNINLWVENKTPSTVSIRRSYAGEDSKIDFMIVETGVRWWQNITA